MFAKMINAFHAWDNRRCARSVFGSGVPMTQDADGCVNVALFKLRVR